MGHILLFLFVIIATLNANITLGATETNLNDAFQAALQKSESIASQERMVSIAEEHYSLAKGSILPSVTFHASYMIQDKPSDPLAASFFPTTQPEVKLTLRQPVFRGLREFAVLKQTKHSIASEKYAKENATRLLYDDVAKSYHAVLAAEESLHNINDQLKLYDERINELTRRVQQGTSNQTDLLALQSSRATVQSQQKGAQASVSAAREAFSFLTGLSTDIKITPISGSQPGPKPVDSYLAGIEQRPDILAFVERTQTAHEQVRIAKGAHAPSVDLIGNYYFKRQSEIYSGIQWDVQAALSFPLFSGGTVSAQVNESSLQRERTELDLTRLRRQSQQQIRTLHSDYLAELESISALEESLKLAEKNYLLLKSDYSRGLTRNLDVLQALISTHEIRRELLRARFIARDKWVELNTASGQLPLKKGT